MSDQTGIEWADSTFNPWMGCTKVSQACDHCYAERDTRRFGRVQWGSGQPRVRTSAGNWKKPLQWNASACWFIQCNDCGWRGESKGALCQHCHSGNTEPARRRVFCASLADVFDNEVDPQWRADLFSLIQQTPSLDWLLLTKRIGNVRAMLPEQVIGGGLPNNVWIGATICNQEEADRDIPKLLSVPAAVRFVSMEPLLGPVDLRQAHMTRERLDNWPVATRVDWVIVGGESGPDARPMHPEWARRLRDQCAAACVPFLFKQWGEWGPSLCGCEDRQLAKKVFLDGTTHPLHASAYGCKVMTKVGKKAAGRRLDGVHYNEYPAQGDAA